MYKPPAVTTKRKTLGQGGLSVFCLFVVFFMSWVQHLKCMYIPGLIAVVIRE